MGSTLKQVHVSNKIKELQWKCIHNIIYMENRFKKKICQTVNVIYVKYIIIMTHYNIYFLSDLLHTLW